MLHRFTSIVRYALLALACLSSARAEELFGLTTGGSLIRFDSESPGTTTPPVAITGLQVSETIVAIDFRTTTGQLYGVGSTSRVYVIDANSGVATPLGAGFAPALSGSHFAADFNPTVDRMRLVSEVGQSLRLNPNDGSVAGTDTALSYAVFDAGSGNTPHIVAVAYTNNFQVATSTTLYGIDSTRDTLVTVGSLNSTVSPNGGVIFTVGKLGVDTLDSASLDISGQTGVAYAALTTTGATASKLYTVNLSTGTATPVGTIGGGSVLLDIATVSAPTPFDVVVLRSGTPSTLSRIDSSVASLASANVVVTGLSAGETLLAIRYRRSTGVLYGLGSTNRIYTVNPVTGAATALTPAGSPLALTSANCEMAIDPLTNRIRIIDDTDQNVVVDSVTGLLFSTDSTLAYKAGDPNVGANPNIHAIAVTNPNAGVTTLFGIDATLGTLVTVPTPGNGQVTTIGSLGGAALGTFQSLDVAFDGTLFGALNGVLHTINTSTGAATPVLTGAAIGGAGTVRSIAAVPDAGLATLEFTSATFKVIETNTAAVTISRTGPASGVVTVDYEVVPDTVEAETNFTPVAGTLTFLNGETSRTILIPAKQNGTLDLLNTATMTLSNPIGAFLGAKSTSTLVIGDLNDRDGDGFTNEVEVAAATDPNDSASTPFGGQASGGANILTVRTTVVRLNFALANRDSVSFSGSIPNASLTVPPNAKFIVQIGHADGAGGVTQVFTFGPTGKAPKGLVFSKPVKGVSKFTITLAKGSFAGGLATTGLGNQTVTKALLPFESTVYFGQSKFTATRNVLYTAKATKTGLALLTK